MSNRFISVYGVRHGQSVANEQGWIAAQIDSPLTNKGRRQAHDAAAQIAKQSVKFEQIVSSPLERSVETAQIIAKELGIEDVQILGELAERNVGDFAGGLKSALKSATNKQIVEAGGESEQELIDRATTIFNWLKRQKSPPLLVAHNGFLRALRFKFDPTQTSLDSLTEIKRHENATLYTFELTDKE